MLQEEKVFSKFVPGHPMGGGHRSTDRACDSRPGPCAQAGT